MCRRTRASAECTVANTPTTPASLNADTVSRHDFQSRVAAAVKAAQTGSKIGDTGVTAAELKRWYGMAEHRGAEKGAHGAYSTAETSDEVTVIGTHTQRGCLGRTRVCTTREHAKLSEVRLVDGSEGLTSVSVGQNDRVFVDASKLNTSQTLAVSSKQNGLVGLIVQEGAVVVDGRDGAIEIHQKNAAGDPTILTISGESAVQKIVLARGETTARDGAFRPLLDTVVEQIPSYSDKKPTQALKAGGSGDAGTAGTTAVNPVVNRTEAVPAVKEQKPSGFKRFSSGAVEGLKEGAGIKRFLDAVEPKAAAPR